MPNYTTTLPSPAPAPPAPRKPFSPLARAIFTTLRVLFVFTVVAFHLIVLAIRNPLDLWDKEIKAGLAEQVTIDGRAGWNEPGWGALLAYGGIDADEKTLSKPPASIWDNEKFQQQFKDADKFTYRFVNTTGIEQRWTMFGPPMARRADFVAFRFHFTDGSTDVLYSENEPADWTFFFRVGGWQTRKYEDYLMNDPSGYNAIERKIWEAYARHSIKKWKERRPGDPRQIERIVFFRHRLYFLNRVDHPNETPADVEKRNQRAEHREIATFDAKGNYLR